MNLFFRRLWIYLRASLSAKNTPLDNDFRLTFRVLLTDQDMFLHMTNSRYLSFSDLGGLNLFIRTGLWRALKANGWSLEIAAQTRIIARMLKSPQTFELVSTLDGWTDDYLALGQCFQRGPMVHADVKSLMRIVDSGGTQIKTRPLLDAIGASGPSPDLPIGFSNLLETTETHKSTT